MTDDTRCRALDIVTYIHYNCSNEIDENGGILLNNKKLAAILACIAVIFVIGYVVGTAAGKRNKPEPDYGLQITTIAPDDGFSLEIVTQCEEETEAATEASAETESAE